MGRLVAAAAGLLGLAACASTGKVGVGEPNWMDEGSVQVHAVSDGGVPLVGGGILRRVGDSGYFGGRAFVPVWGSGSYTGELLWRTYFTPEQPSSLFLEGDASLHLVRKGTTFLPSGGMQFGVRVSVTDTLSLGGSFGPMLFPANLKPEIDHLRLGAFGLSPRMLVSVDFNL